MPFHPLVIVDWATAIIVCLVFRLNLVVVDLILLLKIL
jgi:hypothetical protein